MRRRGFIGGATAAALAAPRLARAADAAVLRFVPQADLAVLDPIWTTAYQTRDHGFLVYDTLWGLDAAFRPQPQMLEGAAAEDDGLTWRLVLRPGLVFHDGTPVLARDCAASIRRWGQRDSFGQALMAAAAEVAATDDRTLRIRLRHPFPLLPDALAKLSPSPCFIMPERLAATDAYAQVNEVVGSGPFRWLADERVPGARAAYARWNRYAPRADGVPQRSAGPKVARFERIEMVVIPDPTTASAALQRGEVDWWLTISTDLLPSLRRSPDVVARTQDSTGQIATMRFNQLTPPFNNPAMRRAMLGAVAQSDYMQAVAGDDRTLWRDGVGFFCPGTPMASDAGMAALTGPRDLDGVKRAIEAAGYRGERVALLDPTDIQSTAALASVSADWMRRVGLNLDDQAMDWGTAVQRRTRQDAPDHGGWSVFQTSWAGLDQFNPAVHIFLRGNGKQAAPGWPDSARIEALRDQWLVATDLAVQQRLAAEIQLQAFQDVPYIPLGQVVPVTAFRRTLDGVLDGQPVFWNVRRL